MTLDFERLLKKIGYTFKNIDLLQQALTHRSLKSKNNERMEFLGDAIISFIIANLLFETHQKSREGDLSRFRASLVNRESLAEIANEFDLGSYVRLGVGELRSGGFRRPSILADALEAIVAAIYLDSDIIVCQRVVSAWFEDKLAQCSSTHALKDPKTLLQEFLQSKKLHLPIYELMEVKGEHHQQEFFVECKIEELNINAVGHGVSRRKAEQMAAELCLEKLNNAK